MTESKNITLSRKACFALVRRAIARTGLPALLSLMCVAPAWAQPPGHIAEGIAVIYPDIGEPYRSVFGQIIGGIEDKARGRVVSFPIGANPNPGELNESLRRQGVRVAIALGRQGMKAAGDEGGILAGSGIGVVVDGVLAAQEGEARNMQVNPCRLTRCCCSPG